MKRRVGIMISGRGSNMEALIRAAAAPDYPATIVLVLANDPAAKGLATAAAAGIPTAVVDHRPFGKDRLSFEQAIDAEMRKAGVEIICLAGFMRLLTAWFTAQWQDRLLNIHPALLPSFKGLHTHERALAAGVRWHGATVHLVRPAMDEGPIIAQAAVPVLPEDDVESLSARVLAAEHRLYPQALALLASGQARVVGERVIVPEGPVPLSQMNPTPHAQGWWT